jgi:lipopolysaccharide/colanic/teichoic acid biosynthesis glycosyltransferase
MFDVIVSSTALIFLSPIIFLIMLAIKLDDRGPVFFIQDRVGSGGRNFRCYKFRTMIVGAEKIGNRLTVTADDQRITRVGRLLRNWTLDEIPQLINVLKGDMSIVGPRPWVPAQAAYCSSEDSRRFDFKPGMAGLAWINGRNRLPWNERVRLDLCYVDHWSLWLDFSILLKAAVLLFHREGVYFPESAQPASSEHGALSMEQRTLSEEQGAKRSPVFGPPSATL